MEYVLTTQALSKHYGHFKALDLWIRRKKRCR